MSFQTGCAFMRLALLTITMILSLTIAEDADGSTAPAPVDPLGHIALFNRQSFGGNVLDGTGGLSDHWVVFFCVPWWETCQGMWEPYRSSARQYDAALNADRLLSTSVRFAMVDCATDKDLCNEQLVTDYPTVVHYNDGIRVDAWGGSGPVKVLKKQLSKFLKQELDATAGGPRLARRLNAENTKSSPVASATLASVAPMVAVLAVFLFHIVNSVNALWLTHLNARRQKADTEQEPKPIVTAEPTSAVDHISRFLPREWADEHSSIEL